MPLYVYLYMAALTGIGIALLLRQSWRLSLTWFAFAGEQALELGVYMMVGIMSFWGYVALKLTILFIIWHWVANITYENQHGLKYPTWPVAVFVLQLIALISVFVVYPWDAEVSFVIVHSILSAFSVVVLGVATVKNIREATG